MTRRYLAPLVGLLALLGTACTAEFSIGGSSVEDAATELIEGELAEQLGLELVADCPEVSDPEVGTAFSCTATTPDGAVVDVDGLVDREDHIDLSTTNVVRGDALPTVASQLGAAVTEQVGFDVTADCGTETVVLAPDGSLPCDITSAEAGDAVAIVTITDTETGDFSWKIDG